ncbi:MAG: dihydrolipoyl dehydrogenase, partial [Bdellovibrionaceae bacterium]|nr:dihydrolipoyl dehydrogenase [Pseudobdellovibrionaceae bacterium]
HGLKTAVIEREYLGGVCLNVGCIPSKAMITAGHFYHKATHQAATMGFEIPTVKVNMKTLHAWQKSVCQRMSQGVSTLLKGNQVTTIMGEAQFTSPYELKVSTKEGQTQLIRAKHFVVATGSRPIEIPGFKFDEKNILSSTGALDLQELPKKLAVIGGGYIGLEIAGYMRDLGVDVTVLEAADGFLKGVVDPECAQVVVKKLTQKGVKLLSQAKAQSYELNKTGLTLRYQVAGQEDQSIDVDKILVTVGRKPNSDQTGLAAAGIVVNTQGFIQVDAARRTNQRHIFAIGDIAAQPMLAHKASFEGILVADVIAGQNRVYDVKAVPSVVFTDPEIAACGLTEAQARAEGREILVGKFPFAANGRAVSMMETDGFVKIVADKNTKVILGVHIVGPEASNLISEAMLALEMGATLDDMALTIHPHPTLGETLMEAAEATLGHAIHVLQPKVKR